MLPLGPGPAVPSQPGLEVPERLQFCWTPWRPPAPSRLSHAAGRWPAQRGRGDCHRRVECRNNPDLSIQPFLSRIPKLYVLEEILNAS